MQTFIKRLLSLAVATVMVFAMLPAGVLQVSATDGSDAIAMYYDDRTPITELGGTADSVVEISGETVVFDDSAVLTYADSTLIATGIGTATVTVDGTAYAVEVTAAPITLLMITGHSIGAGQTGVAAQSVLCEAGQVYSSHGTSLASADPTGVGIGYGASSRPTGIDAFSNGGVIGEASGLAYRWNQLTGEKIWVLNTAVGGTSITKWTKGTTAYNNAVNVFQYAQSVLGNEIAAGHYTLENQAVIYHSCANWGYSDNGTWNTTDGKTWYDSMLNGFKADLAADVDGDGSVDDLDGIGLVPIFTASSSYKYNNDTGANFFMAASDSYPNVFMASLATRTWVKDINSFPEITYTTQGTAVTKPAAVADLFASDSVHLSQVAYNAGGMDIAENLYTYLRGDNTATSFTFYTDAAAAAGDEIIMEVGESISLVPEVSPISASDLTFTLSKNLSMSYPCTITGVADGLGTVKVSQNGVTVATLTLAVGDTSVPVEPSFPEGWSTAYHCVCGNPDSTGNPCAEEGHIAVEWQPWTITNTVPFLAGYWYLPNDIDLTNATDYTYYTGFSTTTGIIGLKQETGTSRSDSLVGEAVHVYVDLNGKTVTGKSNHRIYRLEEDCAHSLTICDTAGGGKLIAKSGTSNTNGGMVFWTRAATNEVTVYSGTFDASGATVATTTAQGGAVLNNGIMKIYGGTFIGGTVTGTTAQGGTICNNKNLYIYGGTIQGGTVTSGTVQGGNIRNNGGANLYIHGGLIIGGTATGTNAQGGNVSNVGNFYMYGGTISGGTATDTDGGNGGCLFTTNGGTMTNGRIVGGLTTTSTSGKTGYLGGCVYVYGGNFTMTGGTIQANADTKTAYRGAGVYVAGSSSAQFTLDGGTVVAGAVNDYGGAIGTQTNGTINIKSGTVTAAFYEDGTPITDPADAMIEGATRISCAGAAIGTWGGTVNITGGTIIAGDGGGAGGGAVSVHGGTKLNMSGGQIVGGTSAVRTGNSVLYGGGAISVYSSGSVFTMTGGSITGAKAFKGAVYVRYGGAMTASGNAVISGNKDLSGAECNVFLSNQSTGGNTTTHSQITIGSAGMGENAKIGVSMAVPGVFTTNAADAAAFYGDSGYYVVENTDGTLSLTTHSGEGHCLCGATYDGCDHAAIEGDWTAWDGKSNITAGGNYYLTQSLTGSTQYWLGATSNETPITINLCLNGHSINSNYRVFGIGKNTTVNLMNCGEATAVLQGCASSGDNGGALRIHTGSSVINLYGNISLIGKDEGRVIPYGGTVTCYGTLNLYGGEIVGRYVGGITSTTTDGVTEYSVHAGEGGAVYVASTGKLNIYAGTVYGADLSTNGTNAVVDGVAGTYTARGLGGAIRVVGGSFTMSGGTVYGAAAGDGGAVYSTGSITMTGGTIYAGTATYGGGAIKVSGGSITMTGGVIDGINPERPRDIRHAGAAGGGGIMLWDAKAVISGDAVIRNCYTSDHGGAIKVANAASSLTLGGSVQLIDNGKGNINAYTPDNVYLVSGEKIVLDGLTTDAKVGLEMATPGVFATEGASAELISVFQPNSSMFQVKYGEEGLYLGGASVVAGSNGYTDLAAALAEASQGTLVTVNEDQTGDVTVPVTVYLDLNGCTLNGNVTVSNGAQLRLIDSATADYTADNRGKILGTVTGEIARTCNTPSAYGHNYKYLTIQEADGSWSAHRIYLTVKSTVLVPYMKGEDYTGTAVNYKTVFKCNDVVAQYVTAYGAKLTGDSTVYADAMGTLETGSDALNARTTWLAGTMKTTNTAEQNTANAALAPEVCAYILLNDGLTEEVNSATVTRSLKDVISAANATPDLTEQQQLALGIMYSLFKDSMDTWTDIYMGRIRICYTEKVLGEEIAADKTIALTFDDGPNVNNSMEDVMEILEMYDQKATFFLIGSLITDETAAVVKAAYDAGHELGNHSYSHTKLTDKSTEEAIADWQQCQDLVAEITGEAPTFFRAPFLTYDDAMRAGITAPFINGISHGDYNAGVTAADIASSVISKAEDGGIILLHVSKGYDWTEEALHTIIPELRSLGYEITTVGGLFEAKGVEPENGAVYNSVG